MSIDLLCPNPGLKSIFDDPSQLITLDANLLIPPDRSMFRVRSLPSELFQQEWLEPVFATFPNLAIHEAVYEELVSTGARTFARRMLSKKPPRLYIHRDETLTSNEKVLRDSVEERIYPFTKYEPRLDNKDDRGEVKSLAYLAAKGLPFFASRDSMVIRLIEKAQELSTGLDNIQAIEMYEVIFYLRCQNVSTPKFLRQLYKYLYYLTGREKADNPEWGQFIQSMDRLYRG